MFSTVTDDDADVDEDDATGAAAFASSMALQRWAKSSCTASIWPGEGSHDLPILPTQNRQACFV